MTCDKNEKTGKTSWRKIVSRILVVWAIYFLVTGGGIGIFISSSIHVNKLSDPEVFPGCKLFIQDWGGGGGIGLPVPFVGLFGYEHYPRDLRIIVNNHSDYVYKKNSNGYYSHGNKESINRENFTLRIDKITFDSLPDNIILIDQTFKLSEDTLVEYIDLPNTLPKNYSDTRVRLYGTVTSEKSQDEQEFVVEYEIMVSGRSKDFSILWGWIALIVESPPPALWFLRYFMDNPWAVRSTVSMPKPENRTGRT